MEGELLLKVLERCCSRRWMSKSAQLKLTNMSFFELMW